MTETIDKGRHRQPSRWTAPYRWLVQKVGKPMAVAIAIILALAVAAAAAIILRAEVTGSVDSGTAVDFVWAVDQDGTGPGTTLGDGTLACRYIEDTDDNGVYDTFTNVPDPLTCTVAIVGGELQIDMSGGWLPGEAAVVALGSGPSSNLYLKNPSSVDIDVLAWDFSKTTGDVGLPGGGSDITLITNAGSTGGFTPNGLPSFVAAGTATALPSLIVEVSQGAPFDSTFSLNGAAVIGETTR